MSQSIPTELLLRTLLIFSWAAGVVGILVGGVVLLLQDQTIQINQYFSRWINTGRINVEIDRPRWIDRYLYKHHKVLGALLFSGALISVYTFLFNYNSRKISTVLAAEYWWMLDAAIGLILVGSVVAAVFSLIMMIRPSLLKDIEHVSNRWISSDHVLHWLNRTHFAFEEVFFQRRKLSGSALIFGGLYILLTLMYFLPRNT